MSLSDDEILAVVHANKKEKRVEIKKFWVIGRLTIQFHWRSSKNMWGRFGGGWQWKLGVQGGGSTWIFSFLICDVSFRWRSK